MFLHISFQDTKFTSRLIWFFIFLFWIRKNQKHTKSKVYCSSNEQQNIIVYIMKKKKKPGALTSQENTAGYFANTAVYHLNANLRHGVAKHPITSPRRWPVINMTFKPPFSIHQERFKIWLKSTQHDITEQVERRAGTPLWVSGQNKWRRCCCQPPTASDYYSVSPGKVNVMLLSRWISLYCWFIYLFEWKR